MIVIVPSRDISGTRNDYVRVYFCALPPKRSLSLSEDKCSPCPVASVPAVTILLETVLGEPNWTEWSVYTTAYGAQKVLEEHY